MLAVRTMRRVPMFSTVTAGMLTLDIACTPLCCLCV
ncbi:hypothetical protein Cassandra_0372 [Pseudomonas phage Cassandra]|nr:hypothetical protein Cassandra_0372 [Pseudomonas phage Cassandra]WPK40081.1 hypothetical protein ETTORE_0372 [Pseudomonas phage Ettore]